MVAGFGELLLRLLALGSRRGGARLSRVELWLERVGRHLLRGVASSPGECMRAATPIERSAAEEAPPAPPVGRSARLDRRRLPRRWSWLKHGRYHAAAQAAPLLHDLVDVGPGEERGQVPTAGRSRSIFTRWLKSSRISRTSGSVRTSASEPGKDAASLRRASGLGSAPDTSSFSLDVATDHHSESFGSPRSPRACRSGRLSNSPRSWAADLPVHQVSGWRPLHRAWPGCWLIDP